MAEHSRYNVTNKSASIEKGVLKNKLHISNQKELEDSETILLVDAYEFFSKKDFNGIVFNVEFLFSVHSYFLGTLYDWAGQKRTVDISKGGMMFAPANNLTSSLTYLDTVLKENMPEKKDTKNNIARKIALIHNEYNAIHPFRDGNGRTVRLFLDLLAFSIGYKMIDWNAKLKNDYMKACIFGATGDHKPMTTFFLKRLSKNI